MNSRRILRVLLPLIFILQSFSGLCVCGADAQRAFLNPYSRAKGSAVDAQGKIHQASSYRGSLPWILDATYTVAPEYPISERRLHHQGRPEVHLKLDLKTGRVVEASLTRSSGFATLDANAVSSFRQWRWKANKWREITLGVTFRIHDTSSPLPRGAIPIPKAR